MVPALGDKTVVITWAAVAVPQLLLTVYTMVSTPGTTPLTMPPLVTVAVPVRVLHAPPLTVLLSVTGAPVHTVAGPDNVPAVSEAPMVTVRVATAEPQLLETVYATTTTPGATALSTPTDVMVANEELLVLQAPPLTVSVYIVNEPAHNDDGPAMVPALGIAFTIIVWVVVAMPQPLVMV